MDETADGATPILDEAVLTDLAERVGAGEVPVFAAMFRVQARDLIATIDAGSPKEIAREAHSMAASAGLLGLARLLNHSRDLLVADRQDPEAVPRLAATLRTATEEAVAALAARFPGTG